MTHRICVVGRRHAWVRRSTGGKIRQFHILRGLARVAEIDFVWLTESSGDPPPPPPDLIRRVRPLRVDARPTGVLGHAGWLLAQSGREVARPYEVRARDWQPTPGIIHSLDDSYDLVFFSEPVVACTAWPWLRATGLPSIVDLYDLEHERLEQELRLLRSTSLGGRGRVRNLYRQVFVSKNARAWRHWVDEIARAATVCLVAKGDDVQSLASDNAVLVPNGADCRPMLPSPPRAAEPRILFTGTLGYPPNLDAVHFLIHHIRPRLVAALGGPVSIRIVGEVPRALRRFKTAAGVELSGYVEDIDAELRSADLVVVPIRFGSGTRLKVLEAFAVGRPVVSTTVGCEGLEVEDSVHLWIADDADAFADRCAAVLADPGAAADMVARARQLVVDRYDWRAIEDQVASVALSVMEQAGRRVLDPSQLPGSIRNTPSVPDST